MDLLNTLAERDNKWFQTINVFKIAKDNAIVRERFNKNWEFIFCNGLGLKEPQKSCMRDIFINDLSLEEVSENRDIPLSDLKYMVEDHLLQLSSRGLILLEKDYPMQLADMKRSQFNGFYDNYSEWREPAYKAGYGFSNVSLFYIFDNIHMRGILEKNNIVSIADLCNWLDENAENIKTNKAGIGKAMASLLLLNYFVLNDCKEDTIDILKKKSK